MDGRASAGQRLKTRVQEMNYSDEQLDRLYTDYEQLTRRKTSLMEIYILRQYREGYAEEHARHGFCRRIQIMAHCIEGVFAKLPPNRDEVPPEDAVRDATVYLQAFVFNAFGSMDNLAHIWVSEKGVRRANGNALSRMEIGFGDKYARVMNSLPAEFRQHLTDNEAWLEYLADFRHALSHRIPLYIPPSLVTDDRVQEYRRMDAEIHDAIRRQEFDEVEELEEAQHKLISFLPVTTHSFAEQAKFVYFHRQMLTDFNMVEDVAVRMLHALEL